MNKELQRVQCESLQALDEKGVIKMFPARMVSRHTALVFCSPMGTPIEGHGQVKMVADVYSHIIDED